jgi:hypothetical protein
MNTNTMNIQLKKVHINRRFSRESIQFTADLYINGILVGIAENHGNGGCTYYGCLYEASTIQRQLLKDAIEYCKNLPKKVTEYGEIDMSLDYLIDEIISDIWNKKDAEAFEKKKLKDMSKGLLISKTNDGNSYQLYVWKGFTIDKLLSHPKGQDAISKSISKLKTEGYHILNTNIPNLSTQN